MVGADLGLLEQRRHQAVGLAAMLHAFADRVDARVVGLHGVVDHDAALAIQAGLLGQRDVRADADRHHHQVGGESRARRLRRTPCTRFLPMISCGLRLSMKFDAALLRATSCSMRAGGVIELALHQRRRTRCTTVTFMPCLQQAVGRFQAEQAAADHHRVPVTRCAAAIMRVDVVRYRGSRSRPAGRARAPAG